MYTYPTGLQRSDSVLSLLGSFWSSSYGGRDLVARLVKGRAELEEQNWLNLMESLQAFSRYETPIFHRENWKLLTLLESDLEERSGLFVWPIDNSLVRANLICNRLASPSILWSTGSDFSIDIEAEEISFQTNPFSNSLFAIRPVFDGGSLDDREILLWLFRGEFDFQAAYRNWGYVLGLKLDSSEEYLGLLNVVFDALVGGTAVKQIQLAYSLLTGIPLAADSETVEEISEDVDHKLVVTPGHVYRLAKSASVTVEVGDALKAGDSLCDGLRVFDLHRGEIPADLTGLSLGNGYLVGDYRGKLVFVNQEVPLTVSEEAGATRVEFELGGYSSDIERFWDLVHANGVESGTTLASLLKLSPDGPEEAANLPSTVNPLEFLVENFLRFNAILVLIDLDSMSESAIGLDREEFLRKIVPMGTTVIVVTEMVPQDPVITMDSSSSASQ